LVALITFDALRALDGYWLPKINTSLGVDGTNEEALVSFGVG
jgi:hypothetical protein